MEERNLSDDLKVNKYNLDKACEEQSSLYLYYAEELAEAKAEKDAIDDKLNLVLAEVELILREDPPEGIKITDKSIQALLTKNKRVQSYKEKLREAKKEVYHLDAAVKALEHRKSEINNLVSLYVAGYFSSPDGKRKGPNDQVRKDIKNKLNKKGE